MENVLLNRKEYQMFAGIDPKVIFDAGANIGVTSVLLSNTYPTARIYAFEPEPENFKVLLLNLRKYPNVRMFPIGLGASTRMVDLYASDNPHNKGGFSIQNKGIDPSKTTRVSIVDIIEVLKTHGTGKIDLMKIDTEGSEYEILRALYSSDMLPDYIMGEAHGTNDFKMFDFLEETHTVSIKKELYQRCYPFYAKKL
jgi:FkbM family methyltransferase